MSASTDTEMEYAPAPRTLAGSKRLADLSTEMVPLVRAISAARRNPGKGTPGVAGTVDATLVLLRRLGLLSEDTEPELLLRGVEPGEQCDWSGPTGVGGCQAKAVALRWSERDAYYLPACATCAVQAEGSAR